MKDNNYKYIGLEETLVGQEGGENKENISSSGGADKSSEKRAAQIGEEKLTQPFSEFNSTSYLNEFYPDIDPVLALEIMEIIKEQEKNEAGKSIIDLSAIKEILADRTLALGEKALESLENCAIVDFLLRKAMPGILKDFPDDHLRADDEGGGPTIFQHIPLMGITDSIIHAEYLQNNREEIERWKEGKSSFDWSSFFSLYQSYLKLHPELVSAASPEVKKHIREISEEGNAQIQDRLRGKIKKVVPTDVFKEDLGRGKDEDNYDLVNIGREGSVELLTSNFCIESATDDPDKWKRGMENITSRVSRGGFLVMTAIRNANWYKVGDKKMEATPVDAEIISRELESLGFEIREISELVGSEKEVVGYDGMVFVLAKRIRV